MQISRPIYPRENDPLAEFREMAVQFGGQTEILPLRDILAVGARFRNGTLGYQDQTYMQRAFLTLNSCGIPVAESFELKVLNLTENHEDDFLKNRVPSELMIMCLIHDGKNSDEHALKKSPLHFKEGIWYKTAIEGGAKTIITFGEDYGEIGPRHFYRPQNVQTPAYVDLKRGDGEDFPQLSILVREDLAAKLPHRLRVASIRLG